MKDITPVESTKKVKPSERPHYVNNADFSKAIVEYVSSIKELKRKNVDVPRIPEYIGESLLKISEGLSRKPNFIGYTYREDMVMDAIENCIRAIANFNISATTRSGLPNAFSYFTQICFFAFIRRIQKEKKTQDIKRLYIESAGIESFANFNDVDGGDSPHVGEAIIARVRHKNDQVHGESVPMIKRTTRKKKKAVSTSIDLLS